MTLDEKKINSIINQIDFSKLNGLIAIVAQDYITNEVLMLAFANKDAVKKTLKTGYAHYWSRSRKTLWKKGETSGNLQKVKEILLDCLTGALLSDILIRFKTLYGFTSS